jgi:hypothetical protein
MFEPNDVATVWIALDDMTPDLGPITYVKSSHRWGDGRVGSSQHFFQDDGGKSLLYSAPMREETIVKKMADFYSATNSTPNTAQTSDKSSPAGSFDQKNAVLESLLEFESMAGMKAGGISIHGKKKR